jgi:hypothetical protein
MGSTTRKRVDSSPSKVAHSREAFAADTVIPSQKVKRNGPKSPPRAFPSRFSHRPFLRRPLASSPPRPLLLPWPNPRARFTPP